MLSGQQLVLLTLASISQTVVNVVATDFRVFKEQRCLTLWLMQMEAILRSLIAANGTIYHPHGKASLEQPKNIIIAASREKFGTDFPASFFFEFGVQIQEI